MPRAPFCGTGRHAVLAMFVPVERDETVLRRLHALLTVLLGYVGSKSLPSTEPSATLNAECSPSFGGVFHLCGGSDGLQLFENHSIVCSERWRASLPRPAASGPHAPSGVR